MSRRKTFAKSSSPDLLQRLSPEEAAAVLRHLLQQHPELRPEAEQFATDYVSSISIEEVAEAVYDRMMGIDLDALNGRAGNHSWGYVEPGDAAIELMEESLQDLVADMKRKAELGLVPAGQTVCIGIVQGLYEARDTNSDGALGWAPDFPAEHAGYIVQEFLRACSSAARKGALKNLAEIWAERVPDWAQDLRRDADQAVSGR